MLKWIIENIVFGGLNGYPQREGGNNICDIVWGVHVNEKVSIYRQSLHSKSSGDTQHARMVLILYPKLRYHRLNIIVPLDTIVGLI